MWPFRKATAKRRAIKTDFAILDENYVVVMTALGNSHALPDEEKQYAANDALLIYRNTFRDIQREVLTLE